MMFEKEFVEEIDQYKYGIGIDNEIVLANSEVISVEKLLNWKLPTLNDYVVYKSGRSRDYMNRRMFSDLVRFKQYLHEKYPELPYYEDDISRMELTPRKLTLDEKVQVLRDIKIGDKLPERCISPSRARTILKGQEIARERLKSHAYSRVNERTRDEKKSQPLEGDYKEYMELLSKIYLNTGARVKTIEK